MKKKKNMTHPKIAQENEIATNVLENVTRQKNINEQALKLLATATNKTV